MIDVRAISSNKRCQWWSIRCIKWNSETHLQLHLLLPLSCSCKPLLIIIHQIEWYSKHYSWTKFHFSFRSDNKNIKDNRLLWLGLLSTYCNSWAITCSSFKLSLVQWLCVYYYYSLTESSDSSICYTQSETCSEIRIDNNLIS